MKLFLKILLFIYTMIITIGEIKSSTVVHPFHKEAGFIEIFIDNQAQTPVYYDNLMVMHSSGSGSVIEVNAYYPFGMLMPGLNLIAPPDKYNAYKFSAKELETALNLNMYDFGARMYDPAIGRWWSPDPLAEKYYSLSPYAYAGNNPVSNIDPTGMAWYSYLEKYVDEDKKEKMRNLIVYNGNINSQEDLDAAGIEGTYLGGRGTGIDEATGKLLYYGADGTAAPAAIQMPEVTVTAEMSDHARVMSSASYLGIYQMQADFWDHPVTRATTTVLTSMIGGGILSNYMHAYSAVNGYRYANVAAKGGIQYSDDLVKAAQKLYPKKAGVTELHHIKPKYLGGPKSGPTVPLNGSYHQVITNEFRMQWPYGKGFPTNAEWLRIYKNVYSKYPLPL